jgi:hypothetical protein
MSILINRKKFYSILAIPIAFIIVLIPWLKNYPDYYGLDIFTYAKALDLGEYHSILKFEFNNWFSYIKNEWFWSYLVASLDYYGFSSSDIFLEIIPFFIYIFLCSILILRANFLYVFFIIHPILILFNFSQLRMAFASALMFFGYYFFKNNKVLLGIFVIASMLTHFSILLIIFIFILIKIIMNFNNVSINKKISILIFLGFITCLVTGPLVAELLILIGDTRKVDVYSSNNWNSSFLSSMYWLSLLMVIVFGVKDLKNITIELGISIVFLSLVVFSPFFTGGYPYRFLTTVFVLILISISQLKLKFRLLSFLILLISFIQQAIWVMHWV